MMQDWGLRLGLDFDVEFVMNTLFLMFVKEKN